ncbi:hypothetical protein BpHYR1_048338 [Brachionus plicatilis]|uniref:Uncharacterized protein n=1 Tax=Brachionus plicatilis TaxID=10195 RepID=A0A3M7R6F2_BRAPC|nr:hypothetical protein BpHYR1_048338 [Brachionus plicatilis]
MIFFMVPISKDYIEKLSVQELVDLIKTQNGSFENEFQKLDDDSELVSCTEAEQMEWLQNVQNSGKPKKLLIELLFKRAELLASIKKMKIEEDSFRNINQSKQSEEKAKSTLQEMATSSKTLIHEDVLKENVGFGLRETRIMILKSTIYQNYMETIEIK